MPETVPLPDPMEAMPGDPELQTPPPDPVSVVDCPIQVWSVPVIPDGIEFTLIVVVARQPVGNI